MTVVTRLSQSVISQRPPTSGMWSSDTTCSSDPIHVTVSPCGHFHLSMRSNVLKKNNICASYRKVKIIRIISNNPDMIIIIFMCSFRLI